MHIICDWKHNKFERLQTILSKCVESCSRLCIGCISGRCSWAATAFARGIKSSKMAVWYQLTSLTEDFNELPWRIFSGDGRVCLTCPELIRWKFLWSSKSLKWFVGVVACIWMTMSIWRVFWKDQEASPLCTCFATTLPHWTRLFIQCRTRIYTRHHVTFKVFLNSDGLI